MLIWLVSYMVCPKEGQEEDVERCAKTANILASHVIQQLGADMPDTTWENIRKEIKKLDHLSK